jgi:hypothetical protein
MAGAWKWREKAEGKRGKQHGAATFFLSPHTSNAFPLKPGRVWERFVGAE